MKLKSLALLCLTGAYAHGAAGDFPVKSVRMIVPFGAGAATDIVARVLAAKMSEVIGQPMVIDNRPGAGGVIGTEVAVRATPDGYTIFVYGINQTISAGLYKKLSYDHQRDFTPLSLYATMPNILVVHPSLPAKNVAEFVNYAKSNPGRLRYGSSGLGASPHLTMEFFKTRTGIDVIHVPYKVMAQAATDLIGGQMQAIFGNLPTYIPTLKAGRIRALAVSSAKRAEQVPDVPTMMESGLAGTADFDVTVWQGIAVPVGTPGHAVEKLHAVMMSALANPDLKQRFFENGVVAAPQTRQQFAGFIKSETARWAKVIKDAKVTAD